MATPNAIPADVLHVGLAQMTLVTALEAMKKGVSAGASGGGEIPLPPRQPSGLIYDHDDHRGHLAPAGCHGYKCARCRARVSHRTPCGADHPPAHVSVPVARAQGQTVHLALSGALAAHLTES